MIGDHFRGGEEGGLNYPILPTAVPLPFVTPPTPVPAIPWQDGAPITLPWNKESFELLKEILKKVQELDTKLGMKECEDPSKVEWIKALEERISKLKHDHGQDTGVSGSLPISE